MRTWERGGFNCCDRVFGQINRLNLRWKSQGARSDGCDRIRGQVNDRQKDELRQSLGHSRELIPVHRHLVKCSGGCRDLPHNRGHSRVVQSATRAVDRHFRFARGDVVVVTGAGTYVGSRGTEAGERREGRERGSVLARPFHVWPVGVVREEPVL